MVAPSRADIGQWFTPAEVVDLALALALPRPVPRGIVVLDPTCGDGAFLTRAHAAGIAPGSLAGFELDAGAAALARARVPGAAVRRADLFEVEPVEVDVVVGNPPYVRQERLAAARKAAIRERLRRDWPAHHDLVDRLVGRGDLAIACLARALRMLQPGGRMAMVVSSALLDAGYAAPLWELIAREGRVLALVEAPAERWFADAAVNAMILVAERGGQPAPVQIARLTIPTPEAATRLHGLDGLPAVAEVRQGPAGDPQAWAARLRAPDIWFQVAHAAGDALVPLGALAEIRRGITSGANEFFYLSPARAAELEIEPALLRPLVRSPRARDAATIAIDPAATETLAFVAPPDLGAFPRAHAHVEAHALIANRPTLRARSSWWALPVRPARLFLTKAYAARFVQRFAPVPVVADQRVYGIHPRGGIDVELLAAVLNSTVTALALESLGRASMGEGALEWTVADAARLPVLDPRRLTDAAAVGRTFAALSTRSIGPVAFEADQPDRLDLDLAVTAAVPELHRLLAAVHEALAASVQRRDSRARG